MFFGDSYQEDAMLTLNNISSSLNNQQLLSHINAEFFEGEVIGIIGKPASGKSLLLQVIAQHIQYDGHIMFNKKPIRTYTKRALSAQIAFHPFSILQNPYLTVHDYLLLSRLPHKKFLSPFSSYDHDVVNDYIALFELQPFVDVPIVTVSSDVMQRALLAFHFIRESTLLMLDNPTQNLSLSSYTILHNAIIKYTSSGKNLCIIASHDLNFLTQTTDKLYIMDTGTIASWHLPADINETIIKKYLGFDVFITRNIYNGKPNVHLYFES